jgi:hypothetical protein
MLDARGNSETANTISAATRKIFDSPKPFVLICVEMTETRFFNNAGKGMSQ